MYAIRSYYDRVVGQGMTLGNAELRWKFARFTFKNQNVYLALSSFVDYGQVVVDYSFDKSKVPPGEYSSYFKNTKDTPHITYGGGFRIALNENFIIAADAGVPLNKQDGDMGMYIGLNWLF